jgi:hypothetical protein
LSVSIFRAAINQDPMAMYTKLQTDFPASKILKDSTCGGCGTTVKSQELELTPRLWRFLRSIGPQGTTESFQNDCDKSVSLNLARHFQFIIGFEGKNNNCNSLFFLELNFHTINGNEESAKVDGIYGFRSLIKKSRSLDSPMQTYC